MKEEKKKTYSKNLHCTNQKKDVGVEIPRGMGVEEFLKGDPKCTECGRKTLVKVPVHTSDWNNL